MRGWFAAGMVMWMFFIWPTSFGVAGADPAKIVVRGFFGDDKLSDRSGNGQTIFWVFLEFPEPDSK